MSLMLYKLLDSNIAHTLAKHKIMTVNDLIKVDVEKLSEISQISPKDILTLKHQLADKYLTPPDLGNEYYEKQLKKSFILRTWIPGLDKLLEGGLRMGTLTEICGTSGSGKTQLAMNVAVNLAGKYKIGVLYVNTKGDLVPSHLASLVDSLGFKENANSILENIKVSRIADFYNLISLLHHLVSSSKKNFKALIIDSIVVLYFPFLGENSEGNEGLSLVNYCASLLKKLATTHNLAVLLVNLASVWNKDVETEEKTDIKSLESSKNDLELKPALGKFWEHVPNTRLFLSNSQDSKSVSISISVNKSNYLPTAKRTTVEIKADGRIS